MGADLKNWEMIIEGVTAEDMRAVAEKAGAYGLSIGSLLGSFINDLVDGAATNGSDERMYALKWFDRCFMFPENTFLHFLLEEDYLEDVLTAWNDIQDSGEDIKEIEEQLATGEMVSHSPEYKGEYYSWKDIVDSEGTPIYSSREAWEADKRESLAELTEFVQECRERMGSYWKEYMEQGTGYYQCGTFDEEMKKVLEWVYKNREYLSVSVQYQGIYKSVIQIRPETSEDILNELRAKADRAFSNRAGTVVNMSKDPYKFVYEGREEEYGCLNIGMLELVKDKQFLSFVSSWRWVDEEEPGESCDVLKEMSIPVITAE